MSSFACLSAASRPAWVWPIVLSLCTSVFTFIGLYVSFTSAFVSGHPVPAFVLELLMLPADTVGVALPFLRRPQTGFYTLAVISSVLWGLAVLCGTSMWRRARRARVKGP